MDGFIRITIILVKVTLKIIEEVIRAILETAVEITKTSALIITGITVSYGIIKYGVRCGEESYFNCKPFGNALVMAGGAVVFYATYRTIRRFM
ncbi:unnamed protein product [Leptidea sinapis]|uniref:Uncharacterized protein n=1 Tax=Leptidea sinapis TaxID=189913 RepID=A0A5E4Q3H6_9NEOP|nr:unnamed protein product [Leptidea sinapis]